MSVDLSLPEPPRRRETRWLAVLNVLALVAVAAVLLLRQGGADAAAAKPPLLGRDLAESLEKRTLHHEAALLWEELAPGEADPATALFRAGRSRMLAGEPERALRDFHGAESLGLPDELAAESGRHVLECYAVLGKFGVRNAELRRRTGEESDPADPVVARIGREGITRSELETAVRDEELMRLASTRDLDRSALDAAVAARLADPASLGATLRRTVSRRALALEALSRGFEERPEVAARMTELRREVLANLLVQERLLEDVTVSDADVAEHYRANPDRYVRPEAVRFSRAPAGDGDAPPVALEEVAGWHVRGDEFPDGGGRSAEADAALFALGEGEIGSTPVTVGGRSWVFRVDARRPASPIPLEEVRDRVRRDLTARRRAEAVERLRAEVAQRHPVEILDPGIRKALEGEPGGTGR